jgi:hypothetical protein
MLLAFRAVYEVDPDIAETLEDIQIPSRSRNTSREERPPDLWWPLGGVYQRSAADMFLSVKRFLHREVEERSHQRSLQHYQGKM